MADRIPAAAVVMTRDEELNVGACLRSVERFAERFVVDSHSTDRTREIAAEHGAVVVDFDWNGRYPKKKQWSLENVPFSYDWVLFLDADEELTPKAASEIEQILAEGTECAGFFLKLQYVFDGRRLRHGHRMIKLAFVNRHRARFEEIDDLDVEVAKEIEYHYQPLVDGPTGTLEGALLHNDRDPLFTYFDRHNRYSDWEAHVRARRVLATHPESQPGRRKLWKRVFARLPFPGVAAFLYSYVVRAGFLDGRAGFNYAASRAYYYWQIGLKQRELRR